VTLLAVNKCSLEIVATDDNALPWEERYNKHLGRSLYRKNLIHGPVRAMEVRLVRNRAGHQHKGFGPEQLRVVSGRLRDWNTVPPLHYIGPLRSLSHLPY